jgi:hypothetical protein
MKYLSQDSQYPGWDVNQAAPEHKSTECYCYTNLLGFFVFILIYNKRSTSLNGGLTTTDKSVL